MKNAGFINHLLSFAPVTVAFPRRLVGCARLSGRLIDGLVWLSVLKVPVRGGGNRKLGGKSAVVLRVPEQ